MIIYNKPRKFKVLWTSHPSSVNILVLYRQSTYCSFHWQSISILRPFTMVRTLAIAVLSSKLWISHPISSNPSMNMSMINNKKDVFDFWINKLNSQLPLLLTYAVMVTSCKLSLTVHLERQWLVYVLRHEG